MKHIIGRLGFRRAARSRGLADGRALTGQSLVEFALVLPMLVVVVLGVADVGRAFATGLTLDSATRDGAGAAAREYALITRSGTALQYADYLRLHQIALQTVCSETASLPNHSMNGPICALPVAAVCVRDGRDPFCGTEASGALPQCSAVTDTWDAGQTQRSRPSSPVSVEVRSCYRFSTILGTGKVSLPFGLGSAFGDIYLQRDHVFSVAGF